MVLSLQPDRGTTPVGPPDIPSDPSADAPGGPRRARIAGMATATALGLVYLVVHPASQDYASGDFRARLFRRGGYLWNNLWFGGHPLPGYGIVSPALGAIFGVVPIAIVSLLVSTWCFVLLVERWRTTHPTLPDPTLGVMLFACGCAVNLWGGRLTFGPAVMFGTLCAVALQRHHRRLVVVFAALCGLSSPVGALSLAIILAALWIAEAAPRRLVVTAMSAAVVPIGLLIVIFPEGGWFPFTWGSFVLLASGLVIASWFARDVPFVRWLTAIYGAVALGAFLVRSPLGGNVVRLGWLGLGPAVALSARQHRRVLVPVVAVCSLVWSGAYVKMGFFPPAEAAKASYYEPLARYLETLPQPLRVEVVPTTTFSQADGLALQISGIARGWESQVDRELNPELNTGDLDSGTYHRWLLDNAVSVVALPHDSIRPQSRDEAAVIEAGAPYLTKVWASVDWDVYRVIDARPLADHGATIVKVEPERLTIDAPNTGWTEVKFRYTDLYRVSAGDACVEPTDAGWIRLLVHRAGRIELSVQLTGDAVLRRQEPCR